MTDFQSRRIDYHRDGTSVFHRSNTDLFPGTELVAVALEALNSTDGSMFMTPNMDNLAWNQSFLFFFPYPLHLRGIFLAFMAYRRITGGSPGYETKQPPAAVEVSRNAAEPGSGDWTSLGSVGVSVIPPGSTQPDTRPGVSSDGMVMQVNTGLTSYGRLGWSGLHGYQKTVWDGTKGVWPEDARNVRAVRITLSSVWAGYLFNVFGNLHLFGDREESYTVDGLEVVPNDDGRPPAVRYRGVPVRSSEDKSVRVFNASLVHTARRISVSCRPGMVASSDPEYARFLLSFDREMWYSMLTMEELGPQSLGPPIWVRRVTGTTNVQEYGAATVEATAGRWV